MTGKKKPKSVDEIVADYRKYHHAAGKSFKERVAKFEEFHDPDNIHLQQFIHHAHYSVFGKPSDLKEFPGAYNEAYRVLDKHVEDDGDKLDDEDKLAEILETYTDTFLQKAMGKGYQEIIDYAKHEDGLDKKALREFKGQLMSRYYSEDGEHPTNILTEHHIKSLKGKKKVELISRLQAIGNKTKDIYASTLRQKALEGLFSDEKDRLEMAKYIKPIFKERGWKHKHAHITRDVDTQTQHYSTLLVGAGDKLREVGYTPIKYEKKEDKKK